MFNRFRNAAFVLLLPLVIILAAPMSAVLNAQTAIGSAEAGDLPCLADALSTTVKTCSAGPAILKWYFCTNPNTSTVYLQIFNSAGTVTLGTTVPALSLGIPASSSAPGAGNSPMSIGFSNAIKVAATTTARGSVAPSTPLDCSFSFK